VRIDPLSKAALRLVLAEVKRQGDAVEDVLRSAGLDPAALELAAGVSRDAALSVWRCAAAATSDPFFGLNVATYADLDILGFSTLASHDDLGQALTKIVGADEAFELDQVGEHAAVCRRLDTSAPGPAMLAEWTLATTLRVMREATGRRLEATTVRFAHAEPRFAAHRRELRDTFGAAPEFDTSRDELGFETRHLALPLTRW